MTSKSWSGVELAAHPQRWTRTWNDEQLHDLIEAAGALDEADLSNLDLRTVAPASVQSLAADIRRELLDGLGFTLLTGFPVQELDLVTSAGAFMMLGRLIGEPRSQNAAGHLLGHVLDVGLDLNDPSTRIYQTHERQSFHTDSSDVVGLLSLRAAKSGGCSMLASAEKAYQLVFERSPELAARLFDPLPTDWRDEQPEGRQPWFEIPVFSWYDERLTVLYQRTYIKSSSRFADAPHPDAQQTRALDLFDEVLNEPDVHLQMQLAPGDIQFVHNHSLLHDRTAFVDHDDPAARRHLLRLWLSLEGDRGRPPALAQRCCSVEIGNRGGIMSADTRLNVSLIT
jgi:alpha-ketoglutarate-dependent taurine dioxygenase